ncbi:hypothetical protein NC652_034186 [Populus alba x Populus x berolinensis]|nr:hypothetical protein NC652_034186 [Populus alba x Populus x berolinensis]
MGSLAFRTFQQCHTRASRVWSLLRTLDLTAAQVLIRHHLEFHKSCSALSFLKGMLTQKPSFSLFSVSNAHQAADQPGSVTK